MLEYCFSDFRICSLLIPLLGSRLQNVHFALNTQLFKIILPDQFKASAAVFSN